MIDDNIIRANVKVIFNRIKTFFLFNVPEISLRKIMLPLPDIDKNVEGVRL